MHDSVATRATWRTHVLPGVLHELGARIENVRNRAELAILHTRDDCRCDAEAQLGPVLDELTYISEMVRERLKGVLGWESRSQPVSNVGHTLDRAADVLRAHLASCGCSLSVEASGDDCWVRLSESSLLTLFLSLLDNSLDAEAANIRVRVTNLHPSSEQDEVALEFVDDGTGLSLDVRDHLFHPFLSTKPWALGLGLFVARQVARDAGGDVEYVRAREPHGAAFRVVLPLCGPPEA